MTAHSARTLVALGALLLSTAAARADDVRRCDSTAEQEIAEADRILTQNLSGALGRTTAFLSSGERDELRRKWDRLKAVCMDDRTLCSDKEGLLGYAHGGIGNRVNVCYYNMVARGKKLCDLAEVLLHEKGHADGIKPIDPNHNDPNAHPEARQDKVYRLGYAGRDECVARLGAGNRALRGRGDRALDEACSTDGQCASTKCQSGKCVCTEDSQCGSGRKCKKPVVGANHCE